MEERNPHLGTTPPATRAPKAYRTPTLTLYGSVAKLTQGQEGSLCEGVSGMPHVEATGPCN